MSNYINILVEKIRKIQKGGQDGWHEARRAGDTGIGKTFEDLLEKKEDNLPDADFFDIEVKTRRKMSNSLLTLFTKSPVVPHRANSILREKYGYGQPKQLRTTVPSGSITFNSQAMYGFSIKVDYQNNEVRLYIYDKNENLIDKEIAWTFDVLEERINKKLKTTAIISALEKKNNGKTYFKYTDVDIMTGLTLENFLKAIEDGNILVDIRLGVYGSGKNKGKPHDHGTAFRIHFRNLLKYADLLSLKLD